MKMSTPAYSLIHIKARARLRVMRDLGHTFSCSIALAVRRPTAYNRFACLCGVGDQRQFWWRASRQARAVAAEAS